ncbi:MAG: sulfatase-like hydrolase/transferase, partial [Planctomycetales bacterium]|nr:sulfatase-like hydrolase/transferase [Planctomycetales bacterium]
MRFQPCLAVLFISLGTLATAFAADSLPNVVLIISDDQAWTDYGFMGHPHIETPNLDQLARQSLTFTRGYVPDSLCRPSLATIITGLHAHQHGIVGNDPPLPPSLDGKSIRQARGSEAYLKAREQYIEHIDRVPTMPKMLGEIGFVSHQSGKWWEGNFRRGGFTHGMTHGDRRRGGRHGDNGLVIGRQGMQPVFEFIDTAVEQNKPFFVWYAPFLPHSPHNPPERLFDKYKDKTDSPHIARYWAMCEWFDETCGQLLKHLDEQGVADNTVVVYVTDNGWINDPSADRYAAKSKRSQYDGGVRTPIMVRWPKRIQPRRDEQTLVSSIDIAPTVLAACGLKPTDAMQGINLTDGKALEARQRIFGEIFEHDIQHMTDPSPSLRFRWVIDGAMKLIVPHKAREPKAPVELYNLAE